MSASDSEHNRNGDASKPPAPPASAGSGTGIISRYRADRGFGFIARYGAPDLFFHTRDFVGGEMNIQIGLKVRFELAPSSRKPGLFVAAMVQRYGEHDPKDGKGRGDDG